jgi:hypothetical protein
VAADSGPRKPPDLRLVPPPPPDRDAASYAPFQLLRGGEEHERGNPECGGCDTSHPTRCACGGLVHGERLDDPRPDGEPVQWKSCDRCGKGFREIPW